MFNSNTLIASLIWGSIGTGFAISLMPGFQYSHGKSLFTAGVGKAIYRDRTRSVPDKINGGHGDAAFADYVWLASYSVRFGGRHNAYAKPSGLSSGL